MPAHRTGMCPVALPVALVAILVLGCGVGEGGRDDGRASLTQAPVTPGPAIAEPAMRGCDVVASPDGSDRARGTAAAPLRSVQRLARALGPGRTGCLRAGTYRQFQLRLAVSGRRGAPATLRSWPGERATVVVGSEVYLPPGTAYVTLRDLDLTNDPASGRLSAVMIQDFSDHSRYVGNRISANRRATCVKLGGEGYGRAVATVLRGNLLLDCGDPGEGNQQHAVYLAASRGARISRNVIRRTAAYAIHLYPDADGTRVSGNIIEGSGYGGVIFASDQEPSALRSDGNVVTGNVIASTRGAALDVFWGAAGRGRGNRAVANCLAGAGRGQRSLAGVALSGNRAVGDPVWADPSAAGLRLAASSPCAALVGRSFNARLQAATRRP